MIQCGRCPSKKGRDTGTDTREEAVAAEAEVELLQEKPRSIGSCPNHPKPEEAEKDGPRRFQRGYDGPHAHF